MFHNTAKQTYWLAATERTGLASSPTPTASLTWGSRAHLTHGEPVPIADKAHTNLAEKGLNPWICAL